MLPQLHRLIFLICLGVLMGSIDLVQGATPPDKTPRVIKMGVQPLGYPAAMIGAAIGRDAILKRELALHGYSLAAVPFRKGNDMVDLVGTSIDAAMLGDMPTIRLVAKTEIRVVGLVKQTFSSMSAAR